MIDNPETEFMNRKLATVPTLPEEDADGLDRLMFAVTDPEPDPTAPADMEQIAARIDAVTQRIHQLADTWRAMRADPRTPEQIEADELAAEWRETYNSLR